MTVLPVACVFPGQGSQKKGMGGELFDRYDELTAIADRILGYSIRELCLENPGGRLRQTEYTQPALFVVGALSWLARQESQGPPEFLAGHSLGEYNALFAAGCFDFETGLRLVQQRGALMAKVESGGMAAVLGLAEEKVREVLEARGGTVDIANFNLPTQLVLAGPKADVEALVEPLQQTGAERCVVLNVSGAFHSRYMAPVAEEYEAFLRSFSFAPPEIPVLANVDARPYEAGSVAAGLVEQIRSSVRWAETLDFLLGQGVETLEELGPGNVLTKLWATVREAAVAGEAEKAARTLGDEEFRREYGLSYAYVGGASAPGVRGVEFVAALAREGCLAFLDDRRGTEGLAAGVQELRRRLGPQASFGIRLEDDPLRPVEDGGEEARRVEVALSQGVTCVEAAGYHRLTPALVRYRFSGARRDADGTPHAPHRVMALVSRPGAAKLFLEPPPEGIVDDLLAAGQLQAAEAEIAKVLPVASDLCVVTGAAEGGDLATLLPAVLALREEAQEKNGGPRVRVGAGGAIGTPEAAACALLLGADFLQTGSVNLSSLEAQTPDAVKELLAKLEAGETVSAPSAEGFSLGGRVQVVKKGTFFAPRAQKLYELFRFYDSLEAIDPVVREKIEQTYLKRSFDQIWQEVRETPPAGSSGVDPKTRMARVFRWYLEQSLRWALDGDLAEKVNFQMPCDESMAAFNRYAAGNGLADPASRSAAAIARSLLRDTATYLSHRLSAMSHRV